MANCSEAVVRRSGIIPQVAVTTRPHQHLPLIMASIESWDSSYIYIYDLDPNITILEARRPVDCPVLVARSATYFVLHSYRLILSESLKPIGSNSVILGSNIINLITRWGGFNCISLQTPFGYLTFQATGALRSSSLSRHLLGLQFQCLGFSQTAVASDRSK
jgi:hypothetical protein